MAEDFVTLTYTGVDRTIRKYQQIYDVVDNPKMPPIVRAIAEVWAVNFDTEGSMVGGWRDLSDATNRLRESRGHPPAHPILKQAGGLRAAAIDSLRSINSDSGGHSTKGASMQFHARNKGFDLSITGTKVSNQFRSRAAGKFSSPPRRFWFVNDKVVSAAQKALLDGIKKEISGL